MNLRLPLDRPEWMLCAKCRGVNPELFFPTQGVDSTQAKMVCTGCPVKAECAEAGSVELQGVWGGLSPRDRKRQRAVRAIDHGTAGGYSAHLVRGEPACRLCLEARNAYTAEYKERRREVS